MKNPNYICLRIPMLQMNNVLNTSGFGPWLCLPACSLAQVLIQDPVFNPNLCLGIGQNKVNATTCFLFIWGFPFKTVYFGVPPWPWKPSYWPMPPSLWGISISLRLTPWRAREDVSQGGFLSNLGSITGWWFKPLKRSKNRTWQLNISRDATDKSATHDDFSLIILHYQRFIAKYTMCTMEPSMYHNLPNEYYPEANQGKLPSYPDLL